MAGNRLTDLLCAAVIGAVLPARHWLLLDLFLATYRVGRLRTARG